MSDEDQSSKTEEPTEKKLKKAREKGDVPQSKETGTVMVVFSLLLVTVFVLPGTIPDLVATLTRPLELAGQIEIGTDASGIHDTGRTMRDLALGAAYALAPVIGVMLLAAIFGVLIQGETVVSLERIKPKPSKISPLAGFKRLFSADSFVEFLKNAAKVALIATISVVVIRNTLGDLAQVRGFVPERLPHVALDAIQSILTAASAFLVPVALADILWKRAQWTKKQKMSLKEVRDELKDSEGDPHIKARRSEIRRSRARQRIAAAVPTASVILTNPTHYAVALKYEPGIDSAPTCVAKGTDLMARQIRTLARDNEVPIIENRPLARALHDSVEVDQQIPFEHWAAVAEIIGYVMDLRRNIRRKPPVGSELREDAF